MTGVVHKKTGPVSLLVKLSSGQYRRCHVDQVRKRSVEVPREISVEPDIPEPSTAPTQEPTPEVPDQESPGVERDTPSPPTSPATDPGTQTPRRSYPQRTRTQVTRFEPTWNT